MQYEQPNYRRFPKVPIDRRAYAFLIDFVTVWLLSSFAGANFIWQFLVFILSWLGLRVILVEKNQGQSLGSYALDIKIIDARFNKLPGVLPLAKREGVLGGAAFLAMIGLNIGLLNAISMLLLISPLLADCCVALADEERSQAFHDRLAETIVIQTRRGFSLDLRIKKLIAQVRRNMRK